jgi:formate hydrogenlyase subunit 3/multisubunit Na+/H+ antiporter MnhD subunit
MLVILVAEGRVLVAGVGFDLSPLTRIVLFVVDISLLCSLFVSWSSPARPDRQWGVWATAVTSSLLAGALLAQDGIVSILCLFGAAIAVGGSASAVPLSLLRGDGAATQADEARAVPAKRITGGLKHLSISVAGTGLLVVGVLLLSRYGLSLENKALLQLGVGLLSIGLLLRAGALPFASASADLIDSAPGPAINLLGAATPAVIVVGLLLLAPVDRTLFTGNPSSTAWIGAVAVLLAGVRALGVRLPDRPIGDSDNTSPPASPFAALRAKGLPPTPFMPSELVAATIALHVGWALTGALTRSDAGAAGAFLLSVNVALAVPLIIVSAGLARSSILFRVGLVVGVASLLGLPPFGGFAGTLLVAQASVNLSGFWLAVMLLGSMLVAAKWVASLRELRITNKEALPGRVRMDMGLILVVALVIAQVVLLLVASSIAAMSQALAAPWLR